MDRQETTSQRTYPFPLHNDIPQPPIAYESLNFHLAHTFCLVPAYSESIEGLRTTLGSFATGYPNSHTLMLLIAGGMVKLSTYCSAIYLYSVRVLYFSPHDQSTQNHAWQCDLFVWLLYAVLHQGAQGNAGYWVLVLANPVTVEHSEYAVDALHNYSSKRIVI